MAGGAEEAAGTAMQSSPIFKVSLGYPNGAAPSHLCLLNGGVFAGEECVCTAWVSAQQGSFQKFQSPGIEAEMRLLQLQAIRLVFRGPDSELKAQSGHCQTLFPTVVSPLWIPNPFGP